MSKTVAEIPQEIFDERRRRTEAALSAEGMPSLLVSRLSNIRYLTGFSGTAGYLVVGPSGGHASLFVDVRYRDQAIEQTRGVEVVGDCAPPKLWSAVCQAIWERSPKGCAIEGNHLSTAQSVDLQTNGFAIVVTRGVIEAARTVKDEYEIARLREAGAIADAVLEHLAGWLHPGLTEREVAGEVERQERQLGASGSATEVIIASGPRSALPHGRASERTLHPGEPVMIDISPTVEGYRADVTRTFHIGPATDDFQRIYSLVQAAQRDSQDSLRPGAVARDIDAVARSVISSAGHGEHFEHSLGHGVGLDVHEEPMISPDSAAILQTGMVVTVEPGVYVPSLAGVRIENSVVVVDGGSQALNNFTTELVAIPATQ